MRRTVIWFVVGAAVLVTAVATWSSFGPGSEQHMPEEWASELEEEAVEFGSKQEELRYYRHRLAVEAEALRRREAALRRLAASRGETEGDEQTRWSLQVHRARIQRLRDEVRELE